MGIETKIEWADSTVNPTAGCEGCELWAGARKFCYAGRATERFAGRGAFDRVTLKPGRMAKAAAWPDLRGKPRPHKPWIPRELPRLIFVSDMSDALCSSVPFEYLETEIVCTAADPPGNRHVWIWLTKRPERMREFSRYLEHRGGWPHNLWALTSVTTQATARARIPELMQVGDGRTIRGISVEPIWEYLDLAGAIGASGVLDWVITGGESGRQTHGATYDRIADLVDQCEGVAPCFVKQMGYDKVWSDRKGGNWEEWPPDVQVREMPDYSHTRRRRQ